MGRIGRFQSASVALLPLLTHRETIAAALRGQPGDGPRARAGWTRWSSSWTRPGVALENAFLQRKLQAAQRRSDALESAPR